MNNINISRKKSPHLSSSTETYKCMKGYNNVIHPVTGQKQKTFQLEVPRTQVYWPGLQEGNRHLKKSGLTWGSLHHCYNLDEKWSRKLMNSEAGLWIIGYWIMERCIWLAFRTWGLVRRSRSLRVWPRRVPCISFPGLAFGSVSWVPGHRQLSSVQALPLCHFCLEPADHGLKFLNLWAKTNHSSKLTASGIVSQEQESDYDNQKMANKPHIKLDFISNEKLGGGESV